MSFKAEVLADDSGQWCPNGMAFATLAEASNYARDLASRWTLVREWRVVVSHEPANYKWVEGHASRIVDDV